MHRAVRLALVLLVAWGAAPRLEASPPAPLDLSAARVLASPGWPAVLDGFLPPGRTVEPLTLPLPEGPLLVLGLTGSDPAAKRLLQERLRLADLRGGYVVDARLEGQHPLALVLAEDAAALAAARFELETFAGAKDGAARSLDMTKPDEQGGVRIAAGRRQVTPRFRIRALGQHRAAPAALEASGAAANRFWLSEGGPVSEFRPRTLVRLSEQGVVPVAHARVQEWSAERNAMRAVAAFKAWQAHGVRNFALLLGSEPAKDGRSLRAAHASQIREVVLALRPGGLSELLVVPPLGSDPSGWPDVRGIPEIQVGWAGSSARPMEVGLEEARRVVAAVGAPVLFVETWMTGVWGLPSLPRGRDARLGEVLLGMVVLQGAGAADVLAEAWAPGQAASTIGPALADLLDCCISDPTDVEGWLKSSAVQVEHALEGRFDAPAWQRELALTLRGEAKRLPAPRERILAWYDATHAAHGAPPAASAWDAASPTRLGPADVRAVSDGDRLFVRVRVPQAERPSRLRLGLVDGFDDHATELDLVQLGRRAVPTGSARVALEGPDVVAYLRLERNVLAGDPHPGRVLRIQLDVVAGGSTHTLATPVGDASRDVTWGALIVVR